MLTDWNWARPSRGDALARRRNGPVGPAEHVEDLPAGLPGRAMSGTRGTVACCGPPGYVGDKGFPRR